MNSNNNNQQITKKNTSVDYKYICIKKDVFDSSMIYLNYSSLKKNKYIEIIYKSPSVFLEGLFFKTPPIALKDISIYYKENKSYHSYNSYNSYNSYHNNYNQSNLQSNLQTNYNPTIKLLLNYKDHTQFINILRTIDEHISTYINKYAVEIENDLLNYYNDSRTISSFNYEQIIKFRNQSFQNKILNSVSNSNTSTSTSTIEIHMKSYLDNAIIDMLNSKIDNKIDNSIDDKKYIFTFNISNIYFSNNNNLLPLVKCNRCESV
jgi:hypothetical protein